MQHTVKMWLECVQRVKTGISYIIAQCVGGVVGAYAAFNLLPGIHPSSSPPAHCLAHPDLENLCCCCYCCCCCCWFYSCRCCCDYCRWNSCCAVVLEMSLCLALLDDASDKAMPLLMLGCICLSFYMTVCLSMQVVYALAAAALCKLSL